MPEIKAWILYVVLMWSPGPMLANEQKTLMLGFEYEKECRSIAAQIETLSKVHNAPFQFKYLACVPCKEIYQEACPKPKGLRAR